VIGPVEIGNVVGEAVGAGMVISFLLKKEHPCISRVVIHHNEDVPLPTYRSHMSWTNKVHMEQLAWTLRNHIGDGWMGS
jgi:hypothetical protein